MREAFDLKTKYAKLDDELQAEKKKLKEAIRAETVEIGINTDKSAFVEPRVTEVV